MRFTDFKLPTRLDEARAALKELGDDGFMVAGATSLALLRGKGTRTAVDITRLGLTGIEEVPGGFKIGSCTLVSDLQEFKAEGWILDRVARVFATQQVRNGSTFGGNLVRLFRWSDFPVALQVLDCEFGIQGDEERVISRPDYFATLPHKHYQPGDILTWVKIEKLPKAAGFGYRKEVRTAGDFSLATAAAVVELDGTKILSIQAAVGGALPSPVRLGKLEKRLAGRTVRKSSLCEDGFLKEVEETCGDLGWRGTVGLSDEYAGRLATATIRDAIADAALEALEAGEAKNG